MKTLNFFNGEKLITLKQGQDFSNVIADGDGTLTLFADGNKTITIKTNNYVLVEEQITGKDVMSDESDFGA